MLEQPWEPEQDPAPRSAVQTLYGVQMSARIMAANGALAGGDWCEAFAVAAGVIAFSIGDVCGHGDGTLAARIAIREAIGEAAHRGLDPAQTLLAAHDALRRHDPESYATAIVGLLYVEKGTFVFANAGHPAPLLCSMEGASYLEFPETFLPLGIEGLTIPKVRSIEVREASLLVLYTDGVTEHDRKALKGASELRNAAMFAYNFRSLPTAEVIERQMHLMNGNYDDAAILTAWVPRRFQSSFSE
jgi:serine phosphatase RsbU (regulator of sigma subunit)